MLQDAPAQLRDIHLPPSPSWWPLAPGWWCLMAVVIVVVALVTWWCRRPRRARPAWSDGDAVTWVDAIAARHVGDAQALAAAMHRLLRQTVRLYAPEALQATGQAWQRALAQVPVDPSTLHTLGTLDEVMYRADATLDEVEVSRAMREWMTLAMRRPEVRRARRGWAHV